MAVSPLSFTRTWLSSEDFPTIEPDETKVREDLQFHPDAIKTYLNDVILPALNGITDRGVKSPGKLVFSGAVTATYNGERDVNVKIPIGPGGETTATVTLLATLNAAQSVLTFGALPTGYSNPYTLISDSANSGQTVQLKLRFATGGNKMLYLAHLDSTNGALFVGFNPLLDQNSGDPGSPCVMVSTAGDGKYQFVDDPALNVLTRLRNHIADSVKHVTAEERTAWNSKPDKSVKFGTTLLAASWSAGTYTLSHEAITATSLVELLPRENGGTTYEQVRALAAAMVVGGAQAAGSITLVAQASAPTVDVPVTIIVREDL